MDADLIEVRVIVRAPLQWPLRPFLKETFGALGLEISCRLPAARLEALRAHPLVLSVSFP